MQRIGVNEGMEAGRPCHTPLRRYITLWKRLLLGNWKKAVQTQKTNM